MSAGHSVPLHKRKSFQFGLGLVVTLICLLWAFWVMKGEDDPQTVWNDIVAAFKSADYRTLPIMWGLLFLFYWLKAWRWRLLLAPMGSYQPMKELFPPILIGFAFNNLLPAHLGEFVRMFVFAREQQQSKAAVLSTIVLERIFDVVAILLFLFLGLWFSRSQMQLEQLGETVEAGVYTFLIGVCVGLIGVVMFLIWTKQFVAVFEWCLDRIPFMPERLRFGLIHLLESSATGIASLRNGMLLGGIMLTSMAQWFLNGLIIYIALRAFGIQVSPMVAAVVLGVVAVGVTVPSSPGYFGVVQACFVVVLKLFVDDDTSVFSASIYYHMVQYVPVTLLGLFYFNRSGIRVSDVQQEAEQQQATRESADVMSDAGNAATDT